MPRTHFIFPYVGNKKDEIVQFYNYLDFEGITTIIEPFCGSCAMSYYIAKMNPGKFKYLLNDNDQFLFRLYQTLQDEQALDKLIEEVNAFIDKINSYEEEASRKAFYNAKISDGSLSGFFIKCKIYGFRAGLCPPITKNKIKHINNLREYGIYEFLKNEDIVFTNEDGIEFYSRYTNNKNALILMDPPYVNSCNNFYTNPKGNIYEYLHENDIKKNEAKTYLILENNWIIKLLFRSNKLLYEYSKTYQMSKKQTTHILISN